MEQAHGLADPGKGKIAGKQDGEGHPHAGSNSRRKDERKRAGVLSEKIKPRQARPSKINPRRMKGFLRRRRSDQRPRGTRRISWERPYAPMANPTA
jgi:hypothetical protein